METKGLFAPMPSEISGNIICITDPDRPVIGYVDLSTTTQKRMYIAPDDGAYEPYTLSDLCSDVYTWPELYSMYYIPGIAFPVPEYTWTQYFWGYTSNNNREIFYILLRCVDCTTAGSIHKPTDWPEYPTRATSPAARE